MRKIIIFNAILLAICLFFNGCVLVPKKTNKYNNTVQTEQNTETTENSVKKSNYIRGIWLTYYELSNITKNCSNKNQFTENIKKVLNKIKEYGFNTVCVQVRPCADAFYNSKIFPVSKYCFENQKLIYDPLEIICKEGSKLNLNIEAWINPYRVSQNAKKQPRNDFKEFTFTLNNKIYFNPANEKVTDLIVSGVKEIAENYNISAIHFDDYFYPPDMNDDTDKKYFEKYKNSGGNMSLEDWRRNNINEMIKKVNKAIKSTNKNIKFGISPCGNIDYCNNTIYADVELWAKSDIIDYICPQIYYGFENEICPFKKTVNDWCNMTENKEIYIGLPMYKCGKKDEYASKNNSNSVFEFKKNTDILAEQAEYVDNISKINGIYVFSYSSVFISENNTMKKESENLKNYFSKTKIAS